METDKRILSPPGREVEGQGGSALLCEGCRAVEELQPLLSRCQPRQRRQDAGPLLGEGAMGSFAAVPRGWCGCRGRVQIHFSHPFCHHAEQAGGQRQRLHCGLEGRPQPLPRRRHHRLEGFHNSTVVLFLGEQPLKAHGEAAKGHRAGHRAVLLGLQQWDTAPPVHRQPGIAGSLKLRGGLFLPALNATCSPASGRRRWWPEIISAASLRVSLEARAQEPGAGGL
mmetsp:Transcript_30938/g.87660  ORF Transcript_30938/g.87660 Transcript_30938/m.87660 type:complete len:225 (-) Transcript_30938:3512-4186(-)